jgi:anti-sigma B factor antagonist
LVFNPEEKRSRVLAKDLHRFCATELNQFTATLFHEEGGVPIVSAFGEIDLFSAREFDALLAQAIWQAGKTRGVVVDLRGVEFMDVAGLRVLIKARTALRVTGGQLAVVCGPPTRRLFEAAGAVESFGLYPDLRVAVEGCSKPKLALIPDPPQGEKRPLMTLERAGRRQRVR